MGKEQMCSIFSLCRSCSTGLTGNGPRRDAFKLHHCFCSFLRSLNNTAPFTQKQSGSCVFPGTASEPEQRRLQRRAGEEQETSLTWKLQISSYLNISCSSCRHGNALYILFTRLKDWGLEGRRTIHQLLITHKHGF